MYDFLAVETQGPAVVRRFASILILLVVAQLPAHAQTICDSYQSNDNTSIFRGYVSDGTVDQSTCVGQMGCNEKVRVQPLEVFKGNPGSEITITQFSFSTGVLLAKGHEYLIFVGAPRSNGDIYSGETEISNVAPETLAWLRAYPTAPQTVRIYGEFRNLPPALDAAHILVTLTGTGVNNRTWTTTPDDKYAYSFNDVPPGVYTVSGRVPSGMMAETAQGYAFDWYSHNPPSPALRPTPTGAIPKLNEAIISVVPKGCTKIGFTIRYDSHIKGRVTDTSGQPVADAEVSLVLRGRSSFGTSIGRFTAQADQQTAADGTYDFARVNPGDYSVVVNRYPPSQKDPHPPVFYPAKSMLSDATILHLDDSATLDHIDLVRPDALSAATVHVRVIRKDGSPIVGATVLVFDPVNTMVTAAFVATDANGHADLPLFAGREYTLTAATPEPAGILIPATATEISRLAPPVTQREQPVCAGPVEFIAKDGLTLTPLTPDKTYQACRSAPRP